MNKTRSEIRNNSFLILIEVFFCLVMRLVVYFIVFVYNNKFYVFDFLLCFFHFFPPSINFSSCFFFNAPLLTYSSYLFLSLSWAAGTRSLSISSLSSYTNTTIEKTKLLIIFFSQLQPNKLKEKGCKLKKKSFTNHLNQKHSL